MGWNSWNTFGRDVNEEIVLHSAHRLVELGLVSAGYDTVVIDDFWQAPSRDQQGRLAWNSESFPSGIPALARAIQGLGLKFGIYTCAGTHTCCGLPGSYGFERTDAQTFADWGVDFVKVDFCHAPFGMDGRLLYRRMGQALRQTGRDIVFSACEWGIQRPWEWAQGCGCQMFRSTSDIGNGFESILRIGFHEQVGVPAGGPGCWNDLDMLVVGMSPEGHASEGGCSPGEQRVHFVHWCLKSSPLFIGADLRTLAPEALSLLSNGLLIQANQDSLGAPGWRLAPEQDLWDWKEVPVFVKPLSSGAWMAALYNLRDREEPILANVAFELLGMDREAACRVTDMVTGADLGVSQSFAQALVPRHDVAALLLEPTGD
jgi:alpha-galactosidase